MRSHYECAGCGAQISGRHRLCNACDSIDAPVQIVGPYRIPDHAVVFPPGVLAWDGAEGHFECSRCGLDRSVDRAGTMTTPACPRCAATTPLTFVLHAGQAHKSLPQPQPAPADAARPLRPLRPVPDVRRSLAASAPAEGRAEAELLAAMRAAARGRPAYPEDAAAIVFDQDDLAAFSGRALINRYVSRHLSVELRAPMMKALRLPRPGWKVRQVNGGFLVERDGEKLLCVGATEAIVFSTKQVIRGNFLADGPIWARLRADVPETSAIRSISPATQPTPEPIKWELLKDPAPYMTPEQRQIAEAATTQLQHHRSRAYPGAIRVFFTGGAAVRLDPVKNRGERLVLPFLYEPVGGAPALRGHLRLRSPLAVMAVDVWEDGDRAHLGDAWASALHVAAALVAPERQETMREARVPRELEPTTATAAMLHQQVVGHIRRIDPQRSASPEQRAIAQQAGITLQPVGETWVRPHWRGTQPEEPLEFRWRGLDPGAQIHARAA